MGDAPLADANRTRPASPRPPAAPADPRQALAQQYLQQAQSKLVEEEADAPRGRRGDRRGAESRTAAGLSLSIDKSIFIHALLVYVALTFAAFVVLLLYVFMNQTAAPGGMIAVVTGSVAIGVGFIVFAALSYASVCYLSIIETTTCGHTEIRDALYGGWREWFWTLPSTVGMLAVAAGIGWLVSLIAPANVWLLVDLAFVLLYPVLQLSALETGSPLAPVSLQVVRSLVRRPLAWLLFYALSVGLITFTWLAGRAAWHDPPFVTLVIMGVVVTAVLFIYGWLLGQLANVISLGEES